MSFHVVTLRAAQREYEEMLHYIAHRSKQGAVARANTFDMALSRIEAAADSFPLAVENGYVEFEVREALFRTRRGLVYRILFTIRQDSAFILHVRGPEQDLVD